jgi:hypothetical protein
MVKEHIVEILDNTPIANLTESAMKTIRAHTEDCANCQRAFEAAQISALLIKERAAAAIEPSPFFQTRVLAALREKQANVPAFVRLWKSAGVLVTSMAATTVALAVLTFFVPGPRTGVQPETTAALVPYSAEAVVLDQNQGDDQMTDDQVLSTIYADEDEGK